MVNVNNVARSPGVRNGENIFIIDQGSRPQGDEFRLAGGPIHAGFFLYDLRPDDDGSTKWELYEAGHDQSRVDALGAVMTGLQNVWHAGVNAWHQRMGDLVSVAAAPVITPSADFPGGPPTPRQRGGVWLRGFGENAGYDPHSAADFHQDIAGAQGGIDGVTAGPFGGDLVIAGLLGGYVHSGLTLDHTPDQATYEGGTVGGYLTYLNAGFHADLLLKADLLTMTYEQGALSDDVAARSLGGSVEVGYKYTSPSASTSTRWPSSPMWRAISTMARSAARRSPLPMATACAAVPGCGPAISAWWPAPWWSLMSRPISCMNLPATIAVPSMATAAPAMGWRAGGWSAAGFR